MNFFENFWEILGWVIWLFIVIGCLSALFSVVGDIFRDPDLSGWGKAGWLVVLFFIPFLGVLVYLIARGESMDNRASVSAVTRNSYYDDGYLYDRRILL